jgi:hypothetical protein
MALSLAAVRPVRRAVLCLLILAGAAQARPGPLVTPERKLKAAYLYRVATFVDWPDAAFARPDSPLVVGIAGDDALADEAERSIANRLVHGRPLVVRRIDAAAADQRAVPPGLHVLFVATGAARARLLDAVRSQPVLTVCDGAPGHGCVVGLVPDGAHLRLRIDRLDAMAAQLRISARLLSLAAW